MSAAASLPFDPEQLVARDPVVGRAAERAFQQARAPAEIARRLIGRDPWESAPRVARLVGSADPDPLGRLYDLLFDESVGRGASLAFRFVPPGTASGLGARLQARRGSETPDTLIRAIGEYADSHDSYELLGEARARDYEENAVRSILTALERMLLAQDDASEAAVAFGVFRQVVGEITGRVPFPVHPSWHVFRLKEGWLTPVLEAFDEPPEARGRWSSRALAWLGLSHAHEAVDVLGRVAADPAEEADVRVAALEALAENAREGALEAVARVGTTGAVADEPELAAALDAAAAQLAWQSADAADLARDSLSRAAETKNHTAVANALYTLGRYGVPDDERQIAEALKDRQWIVSGAAGVALATLVGAEAVGRLEAALAEASEPIERIELRAALARADPQKHGTGLHEFLCSREVTAPWALINPIRQAILEAFEAGGPDAAERRDAWAEILNIEPSTARTGRAAAPPPAQETPPVPVPPPVPVAPPVEPGRGTPNAQADAEAKVDRLGRTPLVDILVGMLDDPDQGTPFTFGLFGGWGEGKSSVLRQLEARLKSGDMTHHFWVAWFNAWEYERTDNLAAGLVQQTVKGLVPDRGLRRIPLAWRFAWHTHRARLLWAITLMLVSAAATVVALVTVDENVAKAILGAGGLTVVSAIGAMLVKLYRHPVAAELWTYFRLPDYGEHLGLLPVMRDQVQALWSIRSRAVRGRRTRLVVVVDDLDRCSSAAIASTLDAVRLVMDMPGVAVIVALDERICLRAVAQEYEELTTPERSESEIARDFLAKVVQLPIRLEPPDSLEDYLDHELFGDGRADARSQAAGVSVPVGQNGDGEVPAGAADEDLRQEAERQDAIRKGAGSYSAGDASAAAVRLQREAMRDTSEERKEFEQVARDSELHNPRQLRRLRNTYRFIKTTSGLDWRKLMIMLFWQDCLHMLPAAAFAANQGRPISGAQATPGLPVALAEHTARLFQDDDEFALYREAVLVAVLPRLELSDLVR